MKISLLGVFAVIGFIGTASAANRSNMYSNISMRNSDGDTIRINRGVSESYNDNHRYARHGAKGASRSGMYNNIDNDYQRVEAEPVSKQTYTKGDTYKKSAMRKYFIANPFYQPLKGQFGSVTTGEYLEGTYKFGKNVDRKLTELSIKEDLSYGLTDRLALQGMVKYNSDKLVWKDIVDGGKDEYKNSELNLYGLGIQGRIIDTDEWISTLAGYYEHQKHGVDYFIVDFKAGYKVASSTIYGLLRGWAVNMEGDVYGDYMENTELTNDWSLLMYGESDDTLYMGEIGLGVWTVLAEDWTLNVEGVYGAYDWHNQFSIKGAFGWQPNDYFALNLYAKTSLYDSADGKDMHLLLGSLPLNDESWTNAWNTDWDGTRGHGLVELEKYREWSVGLQVMFQF